MKRGFTLLEVLIAAGVLFMVGGAVVGLSNSLTQGTSQTADKTEANRWANEGLEVVSKIRNDSVAAGGIAQGGDKVWFEQAANTTDYGWYQLEEETLGATKSWKLVKAEADSKVELAAVTNSFGKRLSNQAFEGWRLVCIESYNAVSPTTATHATCNTEGGGQIISSDGPRNIGAVTDCSSEDQYCLDSKPSLNRNLKDAAERFVPPGNVVKIRSVIVWQDRGDYKTTEMATLLTNWKGFEQD